MISCVSKILSKVLTKHKSTILWQQSKLTVHDNQTMRRVLNVAEKNDAAKSISELMSIGRYKKREGLSRYNKIYEFDYRILNRDVTMSMTSVSGHLLNFAFIGQYKKWHSCNPVALFDAPLQKVCAEDYMPIKRTLEREIRGCDTLIIWTDCDREGENIGFEIIDTCRKVKPNIRVYRARFSEITNQSINRAVNNLEAPDQRTSDAVDVRQQLDLRIGAAFTRFQTLRLQKVFPEVLSDQMISYGSCQFPTLGFVVERYKQVEAFIKEPFWKIAVSNTMDGGTVEFLWKRVRLFDHLACLVLYEHVVESPEAQVLDVKSKPKSKWRPVALDTVELEKLASRKLHISAKETMKIAETLYTQGYISYPRTETNIFPKDLDLRSMVELQTHDPRWGDFSQRLLHDGITPRNGKKSDQAHPPIHPIKYAANLQGDAGRVYEFIVRHFLACCSQDAQGKETTVNIEIAGEQFSAQGLMIIARNYLDVYPYDRWSDKTLPEMEAGQHFQPTSIEMVQGETSPPSLLTEADLITLMDKHGIGTDATHAEHIEKIKSRLYVGETPDKKLIPGELGMGLVDGYDAMGFAMSKPNLRADLEADLKNICLGLKDKDVVLNEQITAYRNVFIESCTQAEKLDSALGEYFGQPTNYVAADVQMESMFPVNYCPNCGQPMVVKSKKDNKGFYMSCIGYPECRSTVWFPDCIKTIEAIDRVCRNCNNTHGPIHKVMLKLKKGGPPPHMTVEHESCLGGCERMVDEILDIQSGLRKITPNVALQNSNHNRVNQPTNQRTVQNQPTNHRTVPNQPINHRTVPNQPTNQRRGTLHGSGTIVRGPDGSLGIGRPVNNSGPGVKQPPGGGTGTRNHTTVAEVRRNAVINDEFELDSDDDIDFDGIDNEVEIKCSCNLEAKLLTVRKEGPNTGREFYACPKPRDDGSCGYFLWKEDINNRPQHLLQPNRDSPRVPLHPRFDNQNDPDNVIVCSCGLPGKQIVVQKEGPNKGRPFFGCSKPADARCQFFMWADQPADDVPASQGGRSTVGSNWNQTSNRGDNSVKCQCHRPAVMKTVQKEGPNQGRPFHSCAKPRDSACGFFAWADEDQQPRGSANLPSTSRQPPQNDGSRKPPKCSICKQPGHRRNKCPQNMVGS